MSQYDADYYLRGKQTGKSLYENYRWLPDLTIPMAARIVSHCGIGATDTIMDFGCARGYVVRALRSEMGYEAWGIDSSAWAIENCDPLVQKFVSCGSELDRDYDWIIAKDVLEHVEEVASCIQHLRCYARRGIFAIVPLSVADGLAYAVPEYEMDFTHIQRLTLPTWAGMFAAPGWEVTMSYRVPGIKDNYAQWAKGNGFITARRVKG